MSRLASPPRPTLPRPSNSPRGPEGTGNSSCCYATPAHAWSPGPVRPSARRRRFVLATSKRCDSQVRVTSRKCSSSFIESKPWQPVSSISSVRKVFLNDFSHLTSNFKRVELQMNFEMKCVQNLKMIFVSTPARPRATGRSCCSCRERPQRQNFPSLCERPLTVLCNSLSNSPCPLGVMVRPVAGRNIKLGLARRRGRYNLLARAINNKPLQCSDGRNSRSGPGAAQGELLKMLRPARPGPEAATRHG